MNEKISYTNVSFDFLSNSTKFLNLVLSNIPACVLLLDENMELQAFNEPMKSIFSNKAGEDLLYRKCGEAIGCAYQIEEQMQCGNTSQCKYCELRISALESFLNDAVIYKERIERPFFNQNFEKEIKTLSFSTRLFEYDERKYILLIIEDISKYLR